MRRLLPPGRTDTVASRPPRRPLSYANVVATLALVVALAGGGAAFAATRINGASIVPRSLPGSALKNLTVAGAKIAPNAITSAKVADGSLLARDFKKGQLPAGPRGLPGLPGVGSAAYGESVGFASPVTADPTLFATTDGLAAPPSTSGGAWFGPLSFPANGALLASAAVEVVTSTADNVMSCALEQNRGGGAFTAIADGTAQVGEATVRFTHPFIEFSGAAAPAPMQFRVLCSKTGAGAMRTVTRAQLVVQGTFRPF